MVKKFRKVLVLENNMETSFQILVDEFEDKEYLVDDLKDEVKSLSHIENDGFEGENLQTRTD
jgi:hypothetical protein